MEILVKHIHNFYGCIGEFEVGEVLNGRFVKVTMNGSDDGNTGSPLNG